MSSAEKNGIVAQFQEGTSLVPRDLTKIRVGLSTALMVSVGIPDDVLYDLLVVGKTGVYLLKQRRLMNTNGNAASTPSAGEDKNIKSGGDRNSDGNDDDEDDMTIFNPALMRNRRKNQISGDDERKNNDSTNHHHQKLPQQQNQRQVEVSMQALIDVACWIKHQMDSDKHPIDAAAENSPHRERLEVLNSEVADSLSLFEAASTTMHQNQVKNNNNQIATSNHATSGNINSLSGAAAAALANNNSSSRQLKPLGGSSSHFTTSSSSSFAITANQAQLRLTPRAALVAVYCEPPALQPKQNSSSTSSSSSSKSKLSASTRGRSPNRQQQQQQHHESSSSSDDDDDNSDHEDAESNGVKKNQKDVADKKIDLSKSINDSSIIANDDDDEEDNGENRNRHAQRQQQKSSSSSNNNYNSKKKKIRPPDMEARKELKKFMATDPWRQTAAALFTSLGGDVFATTNGTLPFPVVERVVRLTLHRRIEHAAVEGAVSSLASKFDGKRLSLIEFDLDVVRPLARLLGCDSGGAHQSQGDVGVSSQIRAAQHVIKLFMTPASKLAKDEAARFRGKRNFKDSEELLLAAQFSIKRVKNRLGELKIIDPHVDKIFKNACILEGTGLTHILDLSRFALQDFVQKVKDNRPIAVNPAMALRRKIVDRFIGAVEKAARTLYDHSSACARCKKINDVLRNHTAQLRAKDSTFHQQFYERQKSIKLKSGDGDVVAEEEKKKEARKDAVNVNNTEEREKERKIRRQRKRRKVRRIRALKRKQEQEKLDNEIRKQNNSESFAGEMSNARNDDNDDSRHIAKETSLIAIAVSDEDNDNYHLEKKKNRHANNDDDDFEQESDEGEEEGMDEEFDVDEEEDDDDDLSSLNDEEDEEGQQRFWRNRKLGIDETFAYAAGEILNSTNPSFSSFHRSSGSNLTSPKAPGLAVASSSTSNNNNNINKRSAAHSPLDQTSAIFAKTFDSYFSDASAHSSPKSKNVALNAAKDSSGSNKENNNNTTSISNLLDVNSHLQQTQPLHAKKTTQFDPRPPSASAIAITTSTIKDPNNNDNKSNIIIKDEKKKSKSGRRRRSSSVKSPAKASNYIKPKDEVHACRMRSGQVREIFRMIQMKGTTSERTEKRVSVFKSDNGIGPGWKA